jgi:glycosyltransferase involved in cell wall biosynthesis
MSLENYIYRDPGVQLTAVSGLVAEQLRVHFGRTDVRVIPNGVDTAQFSAANCNALRDRSRADLALAADEFVLLLLGNDWVKKGLPTLLRAMALQTDSSVKLIVAGRDDSSLFQADLQNLGLQDRVKFSPPRSDVIHYYAAADACVGASRRLWTSDH